MTGRVVAAAGVARTRGTPVAGGDPAREAQPRVGAALRIGLAGWSNPPGVKDRRPAGQSHLEHYAETFSCVEINSTFYREHRPSTYEAWRLATPRAFRFAVKMPRTVTHDSGLRGTRLEVMRFFTGIEPLRNKLGAVLIQLPPSLEFEARNARVFFRSLPTLSAGMVACEPRHASWFTDAANALLERFGIVRVAADPARAEGAALPGGSLAGAYFRWHGSPRMYYSSYALEELARFAALATARRNRRGTWCIFDNTARHAAWDNALGLAALLHRKDCGVAKLRAT